MHAARYKVSWRGSRGSLTIVRGEVEDLCHDVGVLRGHLVDIQEEIAAL